MENDFHIWLRENLRHDARLKLGLGDDAAILEWATANQCIVTTDMLAEGVHFLLTEAGAAAVGRKCLAVNLSDVAAMACVPIAAFISLMLPRHESQTLARELLSAMDALANEFDVIIAGGDTNTWDGPLVVNVTVLARAGSKPPLTRSGAKVGDSLIVTGPLGGSILGDHLTFTPRVALALDLHEKYQLNAGMDISDGLLLDVSRMAAVSECGIEIDTANVPISAAANSLSQNGSKTPLEHALSDGEDFELLLAVDSSDALQIVAAHHDTRIIGRCIETPGIWCIDAAGNRTEAALVGYEH